MSMQTRPTMRPSPWLLAPVCMAFTIFGWTHQDLVVVSLCSLAIMASYKHRGVISRPTRRRWFETAFLASAAIMLCLVYYLALMQGGNNLTYYPRTFYKPWLISTGGMLQALTIVWLWHLPGHPSRKTGPIIGCAGLLVISSSNLLTTSALSLNLLALFGGTVVLALLALNSGGRERSIGEHVRKSAVVLGCIAILCAGTWVLSTGVRHLDTFIDRLMLNLTQGARYTGTLGAGERLRIKRQRRITLSPRIVATLTSTEVDAATGPPSPTTSPITARPLGYFRTQVLSTYADGEWTSHPTPHRPLHGLWASADDRSDTRSATFNGQRWYSVAPPMTLHTTHSALPPTRQWEVHLHRNLKGAVPIPYGAQHVRIPAMLSCLLSSEDLLHCSPPHKLTRYGLGPLSSQPLMQHGLQTALAPAVPRNIAGEFRQAVQQSRTAPPAILAALRPLAQQLAQATSQQPVEIAQAIQHHFRQHYRYSLAVNLAASGDPIVDFVLNQRPAYCEYFASGMTLLLRALDIPARIVGGFFVHEYNPLANQWIVRQRDAHAWVEVFETHQNRWIAFDPTPTVTAMALKRDGWWGVLDHSLAWIELRSRDILQWAAITNFRARVHHFWLQLLAWCRHPGLLSALVLLALSALSYHKWGQAIRLAAIRDRWKRHGSKRSSQTHVPLSDSAVMDTQQQFARIAMWLEQQGWPIAPTETLAAYYNRLIASHSSAPDAIQHRVDAPAEALKGSGLDHERLALIKTFAQSYTALRFQPTVPSAASERDRTREQLAQLQALADKIVQHNHDQPPDPDQQ